MTFVGSTANDAGLNAWITDSTDTRNRASAESILAILSTGATFINEYGVEQTVPAANMFLYAGLVAAFALVPLVAILMKGGFRPDPPQKETP